MLGPGPVFFLMELFSASERGRTQLGLQFSTFYACWNHLSFKNLLDPNPQRCWRNWSGAGEFLAMDYLKALRMIRTPRKGREPWFVGVGVN